MSVSALLVATALSASFGLERVDLLSEDTGTFFHYDAPMVTVYPAIPAVRFVEQVKVVFGTPLKGVTAGLSIASQSVMWETPLFESDGPFSFGVGLHTKLLFPRGFFADVSWRVGRFRLAIALAAASSGSWARPQWRTWNVLPSIGVGIGAPRTP